MSFKILPKHLLTTWVDRLLTSYRVVGPRLVENQYMFGEIKNSEDMVVDYTISFLPPKKYLLPQHEVLFEFNAKTMETKAIIEAEPTVIFGVHTCDLHAIQLLDKIHGTGYTDQHYQARREETVIVSIECLKPCSEHAFCKSMATLTPPENYDVHLTDLGDRYAVDIATEKGERLFDESTSVWNPTDDDYDSINEVMGNKWPNFQYRLDFDVTELPDLMAISQKSDVWDELAERCLACGACTKVCPTCYCFDVYDDVDLKLENGQRIRVWDSCMLEKFAVVAGGHNFRTSRAKRLRHRFFRKAKYQYEAYGLLGCVGCGRCATHCPVDITPVKTFNALYKRHVQNQQEVKA